jgi:hypothetical protein
MNQLNCKNWYGCWLMNIASRWPFQRLMVSVVIATSLLTFESRAATDDDSIAIRGEWIRTADAPLSARSSATIAWTGIEILIFGGSEFYCPPNANCVPPSDPPFSDGVAYDPKSNSWRKIADSPFSIRWSETATVGNDVYVLAWTDYTWNPKRLLRYQPAQDSWEDLDLPETMVEPAITVIGRDGLLYYSTSDQNQLASDWHLNTTTGQWVRLLDDPLGPGFGRNFFAMGEDLYLIDHALVPSPGSGDRPSYRRAARLRRQQWEVLPVSDNMGLGPGLVAGSRIIFPELGCADGGDNEYGRCVPFGAVFQTDTGTWHELPNPPGQGSNDQMSSGALSGNNLLLIKPGYPVLDAVTDEWFTAPALDTDRNIQRNVQAAGPYGFAFGGASATGQLLKDAWIWKP